MRLYCYTHSKSSAICTHLLNNVCFEGSFMNSCVQCENFRGVKDITYVKQCVHSEFVVVMACKLFKCIVCFVFVRSFQVCVVWCSMLA